MDTEFIVTYQDVIGQPIFFLSLTLIRAVGYFFIFSFQVHQEMYLPHVLGHYSVKQFYNKKTTEQAEIFAQIYFF